MQYLTIWDLVLTPLYLLILGLWARQYRDKHYPKGNPLRRYYLPGLYVKFGGVIFIALVYQFYYNGGDTFNFFYHSKVINSSLDNSFTIWLKLLLRKNWDEEPAMYSYIVKMPFYTDPSAYAVSSIGAVLGLLNGTTYIPIALLFAFISYTGIWAMYRTFTNLYPLLHKQLAIAFLFIPSTFVWGSAMFKDTICMFGLGWMTYCTFRIFINHDFSIKNILLLVLSFYLIAIIKIYILLAFIPALSLWLMVSYSYKIQSTVIRWGINFIFIGILIVGFLFFTSQFAKELNRYSLEKIAKTSEVTRGWINYASGDEGAAYDLGDFNPTFGGMLSKFPQAVAVTLFRPFFWEAKKVIVALSAVESFLFLFFTLFVLFKNKLSKTLSKIGSDPNILFCLVFTVIFAFAVGISSYNFGALSRYKIPCLPFYAAFLVLLHREKIEGQKKYKIKPRRFQHAI